MTSPYLKIDKGIPVPRVTRPDCQGGLQGTMKKMVIGDSVFLPYRQRVSGAILTNLKPKAFTTRMVVEPYLNSPKVRGIRIWRTK